MENSFDVIVVGAGHAGCEAAAAAANMGSRVLLITMDMAKTAQMSCNPAMGGIAKGQIVREIDALGGYSGRVTDESTLQFRMLNRSKGPAMWSPRAQCDRSIFSSTWRKLLESTPNIHFWQDTVNSLLIEGKKVTGVTTVLGALFRAKAVVLTNGTFLNGIIHVGKTQVDGGRMGDAASYGLSEQLRSLGFEVGRMKTGTPARLDGRTIDFSKLIRQDGDTPPARFSYVPRGTRCRHCEVASPTSVIARRNDEAICNDASSASVIARRNDEAICNDGVASPVARNDASSACRPPRNDEIVNELYIMNKGGYVYIMTNRAGTVLYTGVTSTIANRVCEHRTKAHPDGFTARYNCTKLVYYKKFATIEEAIAEEKRIKGGSRQRKIDLIQSINPAWQDLFAEVQRLGVG